MLALHSNIFVLISTGVRNREHSFAQEPSNEQLEDAHVQGGAPLAEERSAGVVQRNSFNRKLLDRISQC